MNWELWRTDMFGYDYEIKINVSAGVDKFTLLHILGVADGMAGFLSSDMSGTILLIASPLVFATSCLRLASGP
jgi:hypothetical protein